MDRKNRKLHKNHLYSNGTGYKNVSAAKHNKLKQLIDQILDLGYQNPISADDEWTQYVEMRSLITNVQLIEKEICPTSTYNSGQSYSQKNRKQCIDTFLKWSKENGAKFDGVTVAEFSGYELGLQATRDFKKDELYITIPKRIIMTLDNVNEIVIPLINELPMIESMLNVKLALSLLVEKLSPRSFWKPYIDVLPEKFPTVMTFKVLDMLELKASCLLHSALMQCKHIFRQYAFIKKHLVNCIKDEKLNPLLVILKERFTFDLYCWSVSAVMTRLNKLPKEALVSEELTCGYNDIPALIPLWDMANHMEGQLTTTYSLEEDGILESVCMKDFKKGEQILIYYGDRNNSDFLVHNGFVYYPTNLADIISVRLGISQTDPLANERSRLLDMLDVPRNGNLCLLPPPKHLSPELLAFARVFNMQDEHLLHWLTTEHERDLFELDCSLDPVIEKRAWLFLKMRFTILLRAFPTTLNEDLAMLENHKKEPCKLGHLKVMILKYRIIEKRILTEAMEYVEKRFPTEDNIVSS